jgi:hypothetical protein
VVEAVAFQLGGTQAKLLEYLTKRQTGGGGSCTARTGDRNNGMFG